MALVSGLVLFYPDCRPFWRLKETWVDEFRRRRLLPQVPWEDSFLLPALALFHLPMSRLQSALRADRLTAPEASSVSLVAHPWLRRHRRQLRQKLWSRPQERVVLRAGRPARALENSAW